jgi:competence protein ComEA
VTVAKVLKSWAWVVAAAWLGTSSVAQAQPMPHPKAQPAPAAHPVDAASSSGVVNLAQATADELERLPGIGPAKAKAIVEHRHTHPFHKVDDLTKVKGIGKKTFAKLRPYLTMTGPTTLLAEPPRR